MAALHLIIRDPPLAAAIVEQLKLARLTDVLETSDLETFLTDERATLVIDEASLDKKAAKALGATATSATILLLGDVTTDETDQVVVESFAKPFRLGHFMARLKYHLEIAPRLRGKALTFGPFRLESHKRQLVVAKTEAVIRLTEKETALLEYLAQSEATVSKEELLASIWGYDASIDTHTLETHIYQLRRKLDPEGDGGVWLVNEHGAYRLNRTP